MTPIARQHFVFIDYQKPDEWSEISRVGPLSRTIGIENLNLNSNGEPETSVELPYSLATSSSDDSVATDHPLPQQQQQQQQGSETQDVPQQNTERRPHYEEHVRNHRQQVHHYNRIQKQKQQQQLQGDYDRRPSWSKQPPPGLDMASTNPEAVKQRQLPTVPQLGKQKQDRPRFQHLHPSGKI